MIFEVRLSQEHTIAVFVWTRELFRLLVDLQVFAEFVLCGKGLATSLKGGKRKGWREGGRERKEGVGREGGRERGEREGEKGE